MLLVILLSILPMYHYKRFTARKLDISTGQEPLVSTGFLPGTGRSVLNVTAFSTGRSDRYQMTQSSTGHQHRPVLKIFLSKKKSGCFSCSSSLSLSSCFSFYHHCSSFLLCSSRTNLCSSRTEEKKISSGRRKKIESGKEGVRSRKSFT